MKINKNKKSNNHRRNSARYKILNRNKLAILGVFGVIALILAITSIRFVWHESDYAAKNKEVRNSRNEDTTDSLENDVPEKASSTENVVVDSSINEQSVRVTDSGNDMRSSGQSFSQGDMTASVSQTAINLNISNNWTSSFDIQSNTQFNVANLSYKSTVLSIQETSYLNTPNRKYYVVRFLPRPISGSGSMEVIADLQSTVSGDRMSLPIIVSWDSFKYNISLQGFSISPATAVVQNNSVSINIDGVPAGDNPNISYALRIYTNSSKTSLAYTGSTSYVYEPLAWTDFQLGALPLNRGNTYNFELTVSANGWSEYSHTFTGEFTY